MGFPEGAKRVTVNEKLFDWREPFLSYKVEGNVKISSSIPQSHLPEASKNATLLRWISVVPTRLANETTNESEEHSEVGEGESES